MTLDMDTFVQQVSHHEQFNPVITIDYKGNKIKYATTSKMLLWRVDTILTKEPDTIEWISGFDKNDILLDVGANVGMYTIWAAVTRGTHVFAFEPEAQNFAVLNRNILINNISDKVIAYCAALSDKSEFDVLNLSQFVTGGSNHTFKDEVNFKLEPMSNVAFRQGCYSVTLDELIQQKRIPLPQHIKIDVDGIEHKVIKGMEKTLKNPKVKSLLVEINTNIPEHQAIIKTMEKSGFIYSEEGAKASVGRQDNTLFDGVGNYIFTREGA